MRLSATSSESSTSPAHKTWAQSRLRLGQSNVGFWVLTAAYLLWAQPVVSAETLGGNIAWWWGMVGCYVVVQLPFDVVGGYTLPVVYSRREPGFGAWFAQWIRGALVHAAVLGAVGTGVLWAGQAAGTGAAIGLMGAVALGLVAVQGPFGQLVSRLPKARRSDGLAGAVRASGDPRGARFRPAGKGFQLCGRVGRSARLGALGRHQSLVGVGGC